MTTTTATRTNPLLGAEQTGETRETNARCAKDALLWAGLIIDGMIQVAGGTLLLVGYTATKRTLVRDDAWRLTPMRVGTGYGVGALGMF